MAVDIAKVVAILKGYESKLGAPLSDAEKSAMRKEIDALAIAMAQKALPAIKRAEDARKKWLKLWDVVNNEINAAGSIVKGVSANQQAVADLAEKLAKSCRAKKADEAAKNLDYIKYYATLVDLTDELLERANPNLSKRGS